MFKIHSATHDIPRLRRRMAQVMRGERLAPLPLPAPRRAEPARRRWLAAAAGQSRLKALIQRTPGLRDVYNLAHALLTIQGRLHWLRQQSQEAHERLEGRLLHQQRTLAMQQEDLATVQRLAARQARKLEELAAAGLQSAAPAAADPTASDGWYVALEAALRGSSADIGARQRRYLQIVHDALGSVAGADRAPVQVLDLGCGRGEWLSLLRDDGLRARGIDSDTGMLALGRAQGLDIVHGDLLDHLATHADASIGAITAFQVVEHLPLPALLQLLAQAHRVLAPGGVLILETPNPENLQVAAYGFWLDPTHQRPLPPPLLHVLATHHGYAPVAIVRSNPWPEGEQAAAAADPHLAKLLYCEQDYALVAHKPRSQARD